MIGRLNGEAFPDEIDGTIQFATLKRDEAEMMQTRSVVGHERKHSAVSDFRFGEASLLQVLNGIVIMAGGLGILDVLWNGP